METAKEDGEVVQPRTENSDKISLRVLLKELEHAREYSNELGTALKSVSTEIDALKKVRYNECEKGIYSFGSTAQRIQHVEKSQELHTYKRVLEHEKREIDRRAMELEKLKDLRKSPDTKPGKSQSFQVAEQTPKPKEAKMESSSNDSAFVMPSLGLLHRVRTRLLKSERKVRP